MRYKKIYFFLSALVLIPGLVSLVVYGLRLSIDFTGGALYEVKFSEMIEVRELKSYLEEKVSEFAAADKTAKESEEQATPSAGGEDSDNGIIVSSIQSSGENTYLIKLSPISEKERGKVDEALKERYGEIESIRFETIGPTLGRELLQKTFIAVLVAAFSIVTYIAWTFKSLEYGISAVLAMFHDTFILLGSFSLFGGFFGVEVDTLFVTAVLTILSFSVHDTIVVFDRIRESYEQNPGVDFTTIVNKAVSETLVRSLNNSLTIIFMLLALVLLGGTTIRWFVIALLIGTIAGTYSSTFTAAPILLSLINFKKKKVEYGRK